MPVSLSHQERGVPEWQPIRTAPKDGSTILVFISFCSAAHIQPAYFRTWVGQGWRQINKTTKKYGPLPTQSEWCHAGTTCPVIFPPTHWAPFIDLAPDGQWKS